MPLETQVFHLFIVNLCGIPVPALVLVGQGIEARKVRLHIARDISRQSLIAQYGHVLRHRAVQMKVQVQPRRKHPKEGRLRKIFTEVTFERDVLSSATIYRQIFPQISIPREFKIIRIAHYDKDLLKLLQPHVPISKKGSSIYQRLVALSGDEDDLSFSVLLIVRTCHKDGSRELLAKQTRHTHARGLWRMDKQYGVIPNHG